MKNLIWGCTQMIVGMLGIIASQIAFILGINGWFFSGFSACAFIASVIFAAMVVIGLCQPCLAGARQAEKRG